MERILVTDDNASARELLTCVLESRGYQVTTACDGSEALQEMKVSLPDLILLDIEMPGMNGCEVCSRVKTRPETQGIPVVLVSGLSDIADRAWAAGADGFVRKPFSLDTLFSEVRRVLSVPVTVEALAEKRDNHKVGQRFWLSRPDGIRLCAEAT
jgi:twitching motility two-component system response regulator PilH